MRKLLSARLRDERGIALVMAIGITTVLLISGTTALTYTTSSATVCSGALCIFNYTAQSTTSLADLKVDLPVNMRPAKSVELYELIDDIVLRNSTRS